MRKPSASTGIPVGTRISNGHALARERKEKQENAMSSAAQEGKARKKKRTDIEKSEYVHMSPLRKRF